MKGRVQGRVYFEEGFDEELVDNICDGIPETDFWYSQGYARYKGTGEGLEEFKRILTQNGVKIKRVWIY